MKFLKEKKKRGASDSPLYAHSLLSYLHRVEREGKRSSARVLLPLFFLSALKSKKIKKNCDIKKQTNTQQNKPTNQKSTKQANKQINKQQTKPTKLKTNMKNKLLFYSFF